MFICLIFHDRKGKNMRLKLFIGTVFAAGIGFIGMHGLESSPEQIEKLKQRSHASTCWTKPNVCDRADGLQNDVDRKMMRSNGILAKIRFPFIKPVEPKETISKLRFPVVYWKADWCESRHMLAKVRFPFAPPEPRSSTVIFRLNMTAVGGYAHQACDVKMGIEGMGSRDTTSIISPKRDSGIGSLAIDSGIGSLVKDSGIGSLKRDSGIGSLAIDSGIGSLKKNSGIGSLKGDSGIGTPAVDSGIGSIV